MGTKIIPQISLLYQDSEVTTTLHSLGLLRIQVFQDDKKKFWAFVDLFPGRSACPNEVLYLAKKALEQKLLTDHSERSSADVKKN